MFAFTKSAVRLLILLAVLVALASDALAKRVVNITVTVDGKKYMTSDYSDNGSEPPAKVWFYLEHVVLHPEMGIEIEPDEIDPKRAVLIGKKIEVDVQYAGKAKVTELMLYREEEDSKHWHIDPVPIRDMGKSLGFDPPEGDAPDVPIVAAPTPNEDFPWLPLIAGGVVAVALVVFLAFRARKGGKKP